MRNNVSNQKVSQRIPLSSFTPSIMPPETLEHILVRDRELVSELEDRIYKSITTTEGKPFPLLVGAMGMGKTNIVSIIYNHIKQKPELPRLIIAWLQEEERGIGSWADFVMRIFRSQKKIGNHLSPVKPPKIFIYYNKIQ